MAGQVTQPASPSLGRNYKQVRKSGKAQRSSQTLARANNKTTGLTTPSFTAHHPAIFITKEQS